MTYTPTIGLEIHTKLKTKTKMFCRCLSDFSEDYPNTNICPICLAHPGTLPVINKKAVESVLKLGLALNSEIPETSKFDRKNYFYPDLPKGYQISQYDKPLCAGGYLILSNSSRINSNDNLPNISRINSNETRIFEKNSRNIRDNSRIIRECDSRDASSLFEDNSRKIRITRIHLEEDTARLLHMANDNDDDKNQLSKVKSQRSMFSLVDFNRAGVPLMELVTEPVIKSGGEAVAFAKELQLILRYLDISDADMEKGQMRIEANVSLANESRISSRESNANIRKGLAKNISEGLANKLGTKVEIKNLNSFRAVGEAIDYEIRRQTKILESGAKVSHETRGWDENKKTTFSQRAKEEAHDYRYFPEPDLPMLRIGNPKSEILNPKQIQNSNDQSIKHDFIDIDRLKAEIPELPSDKRQRFMAEYNLSPEQTEILVSEPEMARYFEESVASLEFISNKIESLSNNDQNRAVQLLFNYLTSDIKGLANEKGISIQEINITPENFAGLIVLIGKGEISSRIAKDVLKEAILTGKPPQEIIKEKGLGQVSDEENIKKAIQEAINENPKAVEDYKKGKEVALQFLFGQAMGKLKGRANPDVLRNLLQEELRQ